MKNVPEGSRGKKLLLLAQQSSNNDVQEVIITHNMNKDEVAKVGVEHLRNMESNLINISDNQLEKSEENIINNPTPDKETSNELSSCSKVVDTLFVEADALIEIDDQDVRNLVESEDFILSDYVLYENNTHISTNKPSDIVTLEIDNPTPTIQTLSTKGQLDLHVNSNNIQENLTQESTKLLTFRESLDSEQDEINRSNTTGDATQFTGRPKKGRKRKYMDQTREIKKRKVNTNQDYISIKGNIKYAKEFRDYICGCRLKCNESLPTEERKTIFENFSKVGTYEARCMLLQTMIKEIPIKRKRVKGSEKRQKSREYTLGNKKVCKNIFMQTLRLSSCSINVALIKKKQGSVVDGRGSAGGHNKLSDSKMKEVIDHINKFPKYKSHYCRSTTKAEFLTSDTSLPVMYRLYSQEYENPVSQSLYKQVFYSKFNLKRKPLKKDTCNVCDRFDVLRKNETREEKKIEVEENHNEHLEKAEYARDLMNKQFETSNNSTETVCISFDLEKTLPLPRIPTNVIFYKRLLWLYNLGVHDSKNKCYCYTWLEGEAGRGAQEIGSCIRKHILQHVPQGTKHVMLWSDSCGGQNRNIKIALLLKTILEEHPTLEDITQHFLVPGHSFLKNDADFSDIESSLKLQQRLYVADDYIAVMKNCRTKNKISVEKMEKEDFVGTRQLEEAITNRKKGSKGEKVNWFEFRVIQAKKTEPFKLFVKSELKQKEFVEIIIGKKERKSKKSPPVKVNPVNSANYFSDKLTILWPEGKPISKEKLQDLKSISNLIPKDCLPFYKALKGADFEDDIDGFSGELDFELEEEQ